MKNRITLIPLVAIALTVGSASADPTAVKLSSLDRSIFFRDGKGTRGKAGFNGGHYSDKVFDGNFTNYAYQNAAGAELVIPTTDTTTGAAYFVTDFIVGHKGNTRYSLYYTTEAEPATILSNAKDPRNWAKIDGATDVTFAGIRTNGVNVVATAVKYVFDTTEEWVTSLGEVEVWGVDPTELGCLHQHKTEWEAIPATANCTGDNSASWTQVRNGFGQTRNESCLWKRNQRLQTLRARACLSRATRSHRPRRGRHPRHRPVHRRFGFLDWQSFLWRECREAV